MGFKNENRFIFASLYLVREVAQPGSALGWGSRGRKFESCLPDRLIGKALVCQGFCFFCSKSVVKSVQATL